MQGHEPIARGVATVAGAGAASRVAGFLRDMALAALLGAGAAADAFLAAFLIPNLVRRLLGEGALNAAFAPIAARRWREGGRPSAERFAAAALSALALAGLAAVVVGEIAMPLVVDALAPGFDPPRRADAIWLGRLLLPFALLVLVAAGYAAALNAGGRVALAAWTPVALNLLMAGALAGALAAGLGGQREAAFAAAGVLLAAGIAQALILAVAARRAGWRLALRPTIDPDVLRLLAVGLPTAAAAGAGQINTLVAAQGASATPSAVAWLYYADRVFQLPLGLIASAMAVVLVPAAARALAGGDAGVAAAGQTRAIEFALLLTLPAAVGLTLLGEPIAALLYERGSFRPADSAGVGALLAIMGWALPAFAVAAALLPGFLAREKTLTPLAAAGLGVTANLLAGWMLAPRLGPSAAAWAIVAAAWTNAAALTWLARPHGRPLAEAAATSRLPQVVAASLLTGAAIAGLAWLARDGLAPGAPTLARGAAIGAIVLLAATAQAALAQALGALDLRAIRAALRRPPATNL